MKKVYIIEKKGDQINVSRKLGEIKNEVNSDIKKLENINLNIFLGYIWAELVNRSVTVVKLYRNPDRILSIRHLKDSLDYYGFIRGFYEEVNLFTNRLHQNYLFSIFQIVFE